MFYWKKCSMNHFEGHLDLNFPPTLQCSAECNALNYFLEEL